MDPAYLAFSDALAQMLDVHGEIAEEKAGVRSHITQITIELPIELDVSRDESGALALRSSPPMYYVDTSYRPSYHRVRVTAVQGEAHATPPEVPDGR